MNKFTSIPTRINSDSLFAKFLKANKKKIPEDVIVERVRNPDDPVFQTSSEDGILVHAYTLSLGLYLPFHPLISEILSRLGLAPIQLVPNCWRVLFSILALNFMCKINLGWKEFCYCYVVKQTSGGFYYYFCLRDKGYALVTNLPNSERGWKDELIFIKGNWKAPGDGDATSLYSVPRTATTTAQHAGENNGFKPKDYEVKLQDLRKAWSLKNKDWRYLLDPANWNISEMGVESSSMPTVTMEEFTFGAVNTHENDDLEVEMTRNVSSSSSKKRKLIHSDQEEPIFPTHSHDSCAPPPQSSSQLGGHPVTCTDQVDTLMNTLNTLHSSLFKNDYEELDWKSDEMSDPFEEDAQLLEQKSDEEAGLEAAQLVMNAGVHVMSFVIGVKKKNMTIKKLQATIEKQKKEIDELKLAVKRGKMEHWKCSTSTSTAEEIENMKKVIEETRYEVTQMKLQQEQNKASPPAPGRLFERTLSINTELFSRSPSYNDLFSRPLLRSPSYSDLFSSIMKDSEPRPSANFSQAPTTTTHP